MRYKHTLTSAGHGDGVAVGAEVVLLAAAVQGALVVRDAVRRTLRALGVSQRRLVEARPAHWRQTERRRERHNEGEAPSASREQMTDKQKQGTKKHTAI